MIATVRIPFFIVWVNYGLVIAEQFRLDDEADADGRMEFLVGKEAFAIAVVVLDEEVLVVAGEDAVVEFNRSVVVQLPAFAFDKVDGESPSAVGRGHGRPDLIYAAIVEDVAVLRAVDDGYPRFGVDEQLRINHEASGDADAVP